MGDEIAVFPSGRKAKVERIVTFDGDLDEAVAPLSVTLVLDRELDISRGDLIAGAESGADGGAQREGVAGVDGSAPAGPESPLPAEAHQPHRARVRFARSIIAWTWARSSTSRRRRCA